MFSEIFFELSNELYSSIALKFDIYQNTFKNMKFLQKYFQNTELLVKFFRKYRTSKKIINQIFVLLSGHAKTRIETLKKSL